LRIAPGESEQSVGGAGRLGELRVHREAVAEELLGVLDALFVAASVGVHGL